MFTCNTCGLEFPSAESQRAHMKSDWHRYNLKRRVAQLPPIDEEMFNTKVSNLAEEDESKKEKQLTKKEQRRREKEALQEKKREILQMAKKAMLAKIKNGEIPSESPEPVSEVSESLANVSLSETTSGEEAVSPAETPAPQDESELTDEQLEEKLYQEKLASRIEIKPTTCLFSHPKYNKNFDTVEENIDHMFKNFGLYIPEPNYLVDKEGLISYLGEKISFGFCISCNYQGRNAEAAREHMKQKRHMRIPYELEDEKLEISKFYDFLSTYDDVAPVVAVDGEADEEDWEDVSGEEDGESDDEDDLPPMEQDAIYRDGYDLILPSGTVLGHRAFQRYYRQNLAPERVLSEGQGTVIAAETRHMLTVRDRQELASTKRAWARQKKSEDINDRRAQKFINNQPHFRDPLLQ